MMVGQGMPTGTAHFKPKMQKKKNYVNVCTCKSPKNGTYILESASLKSWST